MENVIGAADELLRELSSERDSGMAASALAARFPQLTLRVLLPELASEQELDEVDAHALLASSRARF